MQEAAAYAGYKTLVFERRGRVLWVTIDRAETYNAIDDDMHHDFSRVFDEINHDQGTDIVVLTGAGKAFCAGGDAAWMQAMIDQPGRFRGIAPAAKRIVFSLLELEKPIICRLNGAAAGLGATIALMCDVIIAADTAVIGDPHVKMGFVAGDGGAVIWPQLIGFARAKEFLMTGEMLTAERAERIGLINYVVPAAELDERVGAMADRLANGATWAIRWTKTVANIPLRRLAHELMDASVAYEMATNLTADHQEAVSAFREKRKPKFTGN
ncbi:MAG: enoyl-CoA hydratase/isomerase family protein [Dechloromonas sp.]|nr:MAG: enoyl-CoA hydratase/isomerase family protein [Dechloromonas sp.]